MKTYQTQSRIGAVRHLVNFHDGKKAHADGSPFFDVRTFRNLRQRNAFVGQLRQQGYTER